MVGQIVYRREKGRGKPEFVELGRMMVLRWTLYEPSGLSRWRLERRLRRAEGTLLKAGAGRVLLPEGFPYASMLRTLKPVDPLPFWRAIADRLALRALERAGVTPRKGRAALSAPRLCTELRQTAERLCPQVKGLVIDVPGVGQDYARWLHLRYGLPVSPPSAGAEVTVAFGPGGGRWGTALELYGARPDLAGLTVSAPGADLPEDCAVQMLALLWEQGAVEREGLVIT